VLLNTVSCRNFHFHWSLIQLHPAFLRVLEYNEPMSIVAIPEFDKFLVHCEKSLFSYPLEMVVRAFRGEVTAKDLDDSMKRLAEEHGSVLFLKTGSVAGRTLSK
jgi:RHO1 GDP-GTP exchange protein 1/2